MSAEVAYLVEIPDVYDGWSVEVRTDGTMRNRWAESDGTARPGYERRFAATQEYIAAALGLTAEQERGRTMKKAYISINGCDDSTHLKAEVTEEELAFLKTLEKASEQFAVSGCQPVLKVRDDISNHYYDEEDYEEVAR